MKIALAYSGGLDTSIIPTWLKENYGATEIVGVCMNVGQTPELEGLEERAKNAGITKLYIEDLRNEFADDFILPTLKAGAKYEGYTLGTPMARPLIAKKLVEIALKENCDAVCHGATGKGNDQVRFELGIKAFAPQMKIIAPWRDEKWLIKGREDAIQYAEDHGIQLKISKETNYSKDLNMWHLSHEGLELEDPANEPKLDEEGFLEISVSPKNAPDKAEYITIGFEQGAPVSVNGKKMKFADVIAEVAEIGGRNGIGVLDIVANRIIGMKAHSVSESPAGFVLYRAHELLESLTLDKETAHYKELVAHKYAELVYNGLWFSPLKKALDKFVEETQKYVTGEVKLKLYKGNIIVAGLTSPYSLHDLSLVTFDKDGGFDQSDSTGYLNIVGISTIATARRDQNALDG